MPNNEIAYRIACLFCGQINHATVPIVGKGNSMTYSCENCQKIIIEFHVHEMQEQHT
ncbi:MAG: hypothetical protein GTN97_07105 [Nitrosopumilaceae archaeon]|nr:hypothetical protein [Nitrosopumilaceae archaeon]